MVVRKLVVGVALAMAAVAGFADNAGEVFLVCTNADALVENASVSWNDAVVGKIGAPAGGLLPVRLDESCVGRIHSDVRYMIVNCSAVSQSPFVVLVGGNDPKSPLLADGARILDVGAKEPVPAENLAVVACPKKEASVVDWLKDSTSRPTRMSGFALLILVAMLKYVRRLIRKLVKLLVWITIGLLIFFSGSGWRSYSVNTEWSSFGIKDATNWLQEHSDDVQKLIMLDRMR